MQHDTGLVHRFGVIDTAPLFHHECHHVADILGGRHDEYLHHGFPDFIDFGEVGEETGIVDEELFAVRLADLINDGRVS